MAFSSFVWSFVSQLGPTSSNLPLRLVWKLGYSVSSTLEYHILHLQIRKEIRKTADLPLRAGAVLDPEPPGQSEEGQPSLACYATHCGRLCLGFKSRQHPLDPSLSNLYHLYSFRHIRKSFSASPIKIAQRTSTMSPSSFSLLFLSSILCSALAQYGAPAAASSSTSTATSAAAAASASNIHQVAVGKNGLVFTPDTLPAAAGDTIEFTFAPGGHSVTRSTFSSPCEAATTDVIWSGFASTSDMFVLKVNDTNPIWLYCSQVTHCQAGMAMVINPPYVVIPLQLVYFPCH